MIALEGIDGSGKTTVCKRLEADGFHIVHPLYTYNTPDEFAAHRKQPDFEQFVKDIHLRIAADFKGSDVVLDRSVWSWCLYQKHGIIPEDIADIVPDHTIVLDVPVHVSKQRVLARNSTKAQIDCAVENARQFYLNLPKHTSATVISGELPPDVLYVQVLRLIRQLRG